LLISGETIIENLLSKEIFSFYSKLLNSGWVDESIKKEILFTIGNILFHKGSDEYFQHSIFKDVY